MNQKEKILKLSNAYKAIDNAKNILRKLETLANQSASGESSQVYPTTRLS